MQTTSDGETVRPEPAQTVAPEHGNWTAIVLAGERPAGDPLAKAFGAACKALVPVGGQPMLNHVVRALLRSPSIGRVQIVAKEPERLLVPGTQWMASSPDIEFAISEDSISKSVSKALQTSPDGYPFLITTADHALLTPEIIQEFLTASWGDLSVGAVERSVVLAAYPETRRTWLKFRGGAFSGANLFALRNHKVLPALTLWERAEAHRKDALRLFLQFGPLLAARALTRTITFDEALRSAGERLRISARLVSLKQPEAAIDVDKESDVALVNRILLSKRDISSSVALTTEVRVPAV